MIVMKKSLFLFLFVAGTSCVFAQSFVANKKAAGSLVIADASETAVIYVSTADYFLVQKAALFLQQDIEAVTGKKPEIVNTLPKSVKNIIILGSTDKSPVIAQLTASKKIAVDKIKDKWDAYMVKSVAAPVAGIGNALVITGGNKRGVAYGVFELSRQMGVSPWYWWADVPVKKHDAVYIKPATTISDAPKVKYRGLFINDEAPAFSGWTKEKFGGVNHLVYEKIFELILRNKGNYLWPAMWGNAFNDDDTLNPVLADNYGVVMGTSHHEPMLRAQQEWKRYGKGRWDYDSNEVVLKDFWRKGIQNMGTHESIVTVGMRGDGDMPMTRGTATALLERIVKDQRQILEDVTKKPASETPQLWALYKEVQDYYDKGMRVPDDVTLLLCDDNWGNIRKLPRLTDKPRKGGYGIYYHFDYVGGPRNYKWLNTNPLPRVWEQMHLAYEYNVRDIWIVNVGDIKPMEFPISFWFDYAWNPEKIGADDIKKWSVNWAAEQFGPEHAAEIADILAKYGKYNGRRKPELLDDKTYSYDNYEEAHKVTMEYNSLADEVEILNTKIPAEYRPAFFQLVMHPVKACANLQQLYTSVVLNRVYAAKKDPYTNSMADMVVKLYEKDSLLSVQYNTLNNGKWSHMMDQTHIGYTYWQQPPRNRMPAVQRLETSPVKPEPAVVRSEEPATTESMIPATARGYAFFEKNGYVSIDATHFSRVINSTAVKWKILPDLGRTGSSISPFPVTAATQKPGGSSPHLEYDVYINKADSIKVQCYFSPTLNFHNDEGIRYGVSIDNEQPQIISINKEDNNQRTWEGWVANSILIKNSIHPSATAGKHSVKIWMVDPAMVLQKIVLDMGGVKPSYLGPPETAKLNK
jgi:hypothetical protein